MQKDKQSILRRLRKLQGFQNAVIGVNTNIQTAIVAITTGLGGHKALREKLTELDALCKAALPKNESSGKGNS